MVNPHTNFTLGLFCAVRVPNRHNPSWAKRCAHFQGAAIRRSRFARLFKSKIGVGVNFFSNSPLKTKKLGEVFGKEISKMKKGKRALILGLEGDLGGGKTTFLQGFAKGLGIKQKILSPTFIILKKLKVKSLKFKAFYHIDCYRIQKSKELLNLGFREIISNPQNIVVIEWSNRIARILPRDALILKFKFINQKKREIECDIMK